MSCDTETLSAIHMAAFKTSRGWRADEIQALLSSPHVFAATRPRGFALGRVIVDEAELLTIAVDPSVQGCGVGAKLLQDFEQTATAQGASRAFLEVAKDNLAAVTLYTRAGWTACGTRVDYYSRPDGTTCDAILMEKRMT